ncbi:hypothetical protein R50073_19380 [Maricurvus nonylphenolicus]|uniref:SDR family NAD(P)-dependent oxidoreductase n=1 Tax=Maricurvus nonylphenolicus TaxID=1008307 RepID=UPI0036F2169F
MDFNNKAVVITGGATGIGFSFAKLLGQEGAKVLITGRRLDRLEEAVAALKEEKVDANFLQCDSSKRDDVEKLAAHAWELYGQVDVLINNAGIGMPPAPTIDADLDQARQVFDVNFFGTWTCVQVFGKRFIEAGKPAAIFNVGSENCFFNAVPMSAGYIASKHAMLAMTNALREDTPDFLHIGLIIPGLVLSEMNDFTKNTGMPTDEFTAKAIEQMKDDQFYSVTHPYNMEHINTRYEEVRGAYDKFAPRHEGDDAHDVRSIIAKMMAAAQAQQSAEQ